MRRRLREGINIACLANKNGRVAHLISAAQYITDTLREHALGTYRSWLQSSIGELQPAASELVWAIHAMPGILATLNYDNLLEAVTQRRPVTWLKHNEVTDILSGNAGGNVLHLHGWYKEPESVVFGARSYQNVKENSFSKTLMQSFALGQTLLFIGCGNTFADPNFTQLTDWAKEALNDVVPRHFLLCRSGDVARLQRELRALPWLQILSYGDAYTDLAPFLRSLAASAGTATPALPPARALATDAYRQAVIARYQSLKLEELDATTYDIRQLKLNAIYIDPLCKECTGFVPRVFELPKEMLQRLRNKGELDGAQLDPATLEQYQRAYIDQKSRLLSEILHDAACRKTVLLGDPGSGKSTLLHHVLLDWATASATDRPSMALPLLIELRDYAEHLGQLETCSFLDVLPKVEGSLRSLDMPQLDVFLRTHDSIVMFDGLDEIFALRSRKVMTVAINRFVHDYPRAQIVVTSRIVGFRHQVWNDHGFRLFMLQDLDPAQIVTFLEKWHTLAYEVATLGERKRLLLQRAIADSAAIRQLAGNPLLLTMMAVLNRTQDLPRDRAELYGQCTRLLLHQWKVDMAFTQDQEHALASLDFQDKRALMLKVARAMHSGELGLAGNIIDEDTLEQTLVAGLNEIRVAVPARAARALIELLRGRNFMLCFVGAHSYAFVHRTFLEYFCAFEIRERFEKERSISQDALASEIYAHWHDETWHEVLCLLAGMISGKFVDEILIWLIRQPDPDNTHRNVLLALRCLAEARNGTVSYETEQLIRVHAENLSLYQFPFEAPLWSTTAIALEIVQRRVLKLIAAAWPDAPATRRWLEYVALEGGYWGVRMEAMRLLVAGWHDDPVLYRWLLEQAQSGRRTAQHAITALAEGWPEREEIFPVVETVLATNTDESTKAAAVAALAQLRPDDAGTFDRLASLTQAAQTYYLSYIALRELAARRTDDPRVKEMVRQRAISGALPTGHQSIQILLEFWKNDTDTLPFILEIIRHGLPKESAEVALTILFEYCKERAEVIALAREVVVDCARSSSREAALILLMSELREEPAVRALVLQLSGGNTPLSLRHVAIRGLTNWLDDPQLFNHLVRIAESDQQALTRSLALDVLADTWPNSAAVKDLVRVSAGPGKLVSLRKTAIRLYAQLRMADWHAVAFLKSVATRDSNIHVRSVALHTLVELLPDDAEIDELLDQSMRSKIPKTLRLAAFGMLILNRPGHPRAVEILKRLAAHDKSPELRLPAVSELGRRVQEDAGIVTILNDVAARDGNRFVRASALQELARLWPVDDEIRQRLRDSSSNDPSSGTRTVAADALLFLSARETAARVVTLHEARPAPRRPAPAYL